MPMPPSVAALWRRAHTAFFRRGCRRLAREFSATMPVVCEEFAVVFKKEAARLA